MLLHNNVFIWLVLHLFWEFHRMYVHPKGHNNVFIRLVLHFSWKFKHVYSQKLQNKYLILCMKFHIWVQFSFCSISHIFINIYCYIFYFNLIGHFEFQYFYPSTMVSYHRHNCWLLFIYLFISPPHSWVRPLIGINDYIRSAFLSNHLSLYIMFSLSQNNGAVSPSLLLIVMFCCFYLFPPHGWMQPLVGITDYIRSTLLSDNIFAIYHHCFSPRTMASHHHYCCWLLFLSFYFFPPHGWLKPRVGITDYIW